MKYRLILLFALSLIWSNAYAWWCSYENGSDGWIIENSMYCEGISVEQSFTDNYCVWYRPDDPVCSNYQACVSAVDYKTESCPVHYSGGINFSRTYSCPSAIWTDWIQTSSNCVMDSPTCNATTETRSIACNEGYTGSITQVNTSSCPDPWGEPLYTGWIESANTCVKTIDNPTNVVSPLSPSNPVSVAPVQIIQTSPPAVIVEETNKVPEVNPVVGNNTTVQSPLTEAIAEELNEGVEELDEPSEDSSKTVENKQDRVKNSKTKNSKDDSEEVNDTTNDFSVDIVHGYGPFPSLNNYIYNNTQFFNGQPPLQDMFSMESEFNAGFKQRQEFYIELLGEKSREDRAFSGANSVWRGLQRYNILE